MRVQRRTRCLERGNPSSGTCSKGSPRSEAPTTTKSSALGSPGRSLGFVRDRAPTAAVRRAKELAIQGFGSTLKGVESEIAFHENDSGEVAAATRDAARALRFLKRGARQLRAAGRILGVRVGTLKGL